MIGFPKSRTVPGREHGGPAQKAETFRNVRELSLETAIEVAAASRKDFLLHSFPLSDELLLSEIRTVQLDKANSIKTNMIRFNNKVIRA